MVFIEFVCIYYYNSQCQILRCGQNRSQSANIISITSMYCQCFYYRTIATLHSLNQYTIKRWPKTSKLNHNIDLLQMWPAKLIRNRILGVWLIPLPLVLPLILLENRDFQIQSLSFTPLFAINEVSIAHHLVSIIIKGPILLQRYHWSGTDNITANTNCNVRANVYKSEGTHEIVRLKRSDKNWEKLGAHWIKFDNCLCVVGDYQASYSHITGWTMVESAQFWSLRYCESCVESILNVLKFDVQLDQSLSIADLQWYVNLKTISTFFGSWRCFPRTFRLHDDMRILWNNAS